ncbi:MAG: KAP family NTPase [Bacteroidales bacterium]|nr:KAP family NTPase [Bacteroidales bacterium]
MGKINQFTNKLSKVRTWAKEHDLMTYLILCLTITYILVAYNSQYMSWYDENTLPILSYFIPNIWISLLTFVLIIIAICDISRKCGANYQYDKKVILTLFFLSIVLIICRLSGNYDYVNWLLSISYVDIITMLCIAYTIAAIVNKCRKYYKLYNSKNDNSVCRKESILNDWPIEHKEDDIFDLDDEAIKLAEKIKKLDRKNTWSLAITAPWGTGKTSFLNLILEHINEKEFEVVRFIPRDSKSYQTIQEDFFNSIACVLSKYNSKCSNALKDYMASLQLIDNRGVVEKFVNFYRIWNKDSLKDSIKKSFASLDKKVLVLIDDFDRLSKDEILEVLKLIDSNAAFTNLVFLTAYDKEQVNKSLGDSYITKDACFVDKFFNLEFSIPSRPYSYISRYIEEALCEFLNVDESEKKNIQQTITNQNSIFKEYIPTLRDAKRYINQFVLDFKQVEGDVMVDEYLLVQLVKYRYPEQYRSLYKKEYTYTQGKYLFFGNTDIIYLKEKLDENLKILPILKLLFPTNNNNSIGNSYKHIYETQSFDNYFVNQIYSSLRIRDMQALFSLEWNDVTCILDEWISNDKKSKDFMDYLDSRNMDNLSTNTFLKYAEMVAYLACKLPDSRAYWMFLRLIYNKNLKDYDKKYKLNPESYKERLLDIVKNNDSKQQLITRIHYMYKTLKLNEEEEVIKDDDIWPSIKKKFIQTTKMSSVNEDELQEWLYQCIDSMEKTSTILDRTCLDAYRKRVEESPDYYIKTFVRLGMVSSSPDWNSVACEPFWRQIFGDESQFENFVNECKEKQIEKSALVWNFWQLYKVNDFEQIRFENQGSVQDKIDNNLEDEIKKLEEIKQIEKDLSKIPDNIDSISEEIKKQNKNSLLQYKKDLDNIKLQILLKNQIKKSITNKLKTYE